MTLATSITASYLDRSKPFFESVAANFEGRRICFTIDFDAVIEGWECIRTALPECTWQPTNREAFYTLQHGEFIKYLPQPVTVPGQPVTDDIGPDEMIIFVDSDMILQRKWDCGIRSTRAVSVTACSWPQQTLWQVMDNIGTHKLRKKLAKEYMIHEKSLEFCACFMIASLDQWENIYHGCKKMYGFLDNFKHHAAWQLLINLVVLNTCPSVKLLPEHIVNATWYMGTRVKGNPLTVVVTGVKDDETIVSEEVVYFNHTKFN